MKKIKSEQVIYESASRIAGSRDPHLTNTDKSPSTSVVFDYDFRKLSFDLYENTKKLYIEDKKTLRILHILGHQRFKLINDNNVVLYSNFNSVGNSRAGWKLAQNISNTDKARLASKQSAMEKALANVDLWEYFATFTLNRRKQDRYDFHKALVHLTKFLQYRGVKYFIVGERHKDGAWHFHALLSCSIKRHLDVFTGKALKNPFIKRELSLGRPVFDCPAYRQSFGFCTITPARNREACVQYMTKYVLKTFDDPNFERVSRRRYFTSKGLKSPVIVLPHKIDFENFEVVALSSHTQKVYLKRFRARDFNGTSVTLPSIKAPPPFKSKNSFARL